MMIITTSSSISVKPRSPARPRLTALVPSVSLHAVLDHLDLLVGLADCPLHGEEYPAVFRVRLGDVCARLRGDTSPGDPCAQHRPGGPFARDRASARAGLDRPPPALGAPASR